MRDYNAGALYPHTKTLSSTQFLDYAKDPSEFYSRWIAGMGQKESNALLFGRAFAELYANRSFDYLAYAKENKLTKRQVALLTDLLLGGKLPKPDKPEHEMIAKHNGWKFRATLDDYHAKSGAIDEWKTSALEWTQDYIDQNAQFTFQQWVYWKKTGELPKRHTIIVVDTTANPRQLIKVFFTKRVVRELREFEATKIDRVIAGLEADHFTSPVI